MSRIDFLRGYYDARAAVRARQRREERRFAWLCVCLPLAALALWAALWPAAAMIVSMLNI